MLVLSAQDERALTVTALAQVMIDSPALSLDQFFF
jgi:hypothetical protein